MRSLLLLIAVVLPAAFKPAWYRRALGWKVGQGVRIGMSYLDAREAEIGEGVRIGHFNVVRSVQRFVVGNGSTIGNFNSFFGAVERGPGWARSVVLGEQVYVTSRHFFDAAGDLVVGDRSILAGRDTQLWTHTVVVRDGGRLDLTPLRLRIGEDCYVGARATLLFCDVPRGAMVGAASVVTQSFEASEDGRMLIAGNPARVVKMYPRAAPAGELKFASEDPGSDSRGRPPFEK